MNSTLALVTSTPATDCGWSCTRHWSIDSSDNMWPTTHYFNKSMYTTVVLVKWMLFLSLVDQRDPSTSCGMASITPIWYWAKMTQYLSIRWAFSLIDQIDWYPWSKLVHDHPIRWRDALHMTPISIWHLLVSISSCHANIVHAGNIQMLQAPPRM
jgi:hypothetical protein